MIITVKSYLELDERKLMDVYREGNVENADEFYPELLNRETAIRKIEENFLDFLKNDFFTAEGREYFVLEENGRWISAIRITRIRDDIYYMEALETIPDMRKRGYAQKLLSSVVNELKKRGTFKIYSCVNKKNEASIRTHLACGFEIVSETGYCYLDDTKNDRAYSMRYAYGMETIVSIKDFDMFNERKMLDIYSESIVKNAPKFYPDADIAAAIKKEEDDFIEYCKRFLAKQGNEFFVLEENGKWVSALFLSLICDGRYYLSDLETMPEQREKGFAKKLMIGVAGELKKRGPFEIYSCVDKKNDVSVRTHLASGFSIVSDEDYCCRGKEPYDHEYGMRYAYRG